MGEKEKGYIRECWSELWNPESRAWQYIDRILFFILPFVSLALFLIPKASTSERWRDMMLNLGWVLPLSIWILFLLLFVPYRVAGKYKNQRNEAILQIGKVKNELDGIKNERPRITVMPVPYYSDKAELEVHNDGVKAIFTATARVVRGIVEPELFNLYWKSYPNDASCPINKGGAEPILVAEISPNTILSDNPRTSVFKNGIALYKMGGERCGVSDSKVIEDAEWKKRFPSMFKDAAELVDECEIDVTITADKELASPFEKHRYLIKIDHENNGKLSITQLESDKEGFQTE
ncbi:MAG: hypothetical protein ABIH70_02615 [Chloroflexota bacterium]